MCLVVRDRTFACQVVVWHHNSLKIRVKSACCQPLGFIHSRFGARTHFGVNNSFTARLRGKPRKFRPSNMFSILTTDLMGTWLRPHADFSFSPFRGLRYARSSSRMRAGGGRFCHSAFFESSRQKRMFSLIWVNHLPSRRRHQVGSAKGS